MRPEWLVDVHGCDEAARGRRQELESVAVGASKEHKPLYGPLTSIFSTFAQSAVRPVKSQMWIENGTRCSRYFAVATNMSNGRNPPED